MIPSSLFVLVPIVTVGLVIGFWNPITQAVDRQRTRRDSLRRWKAAQAALARISRQSNVDET